jgi:HAD superfamily hydrolase (TIGR01509 family)
MPLDIPRIQAICFDVDGTLSDTDDQWTARLSRIFQPFARLFPKHDVRPFSRWVIMGAESPGNLVYTFLDWTGMDGALARLYNFASRNRLYRRRKEFWIIPQVKETLAALHPHFQLSVVSARDQAATLDFLQQYQLHLFMRCVASSQTCEHTKPFPDPVLWAARQMGIAPERCLMVGDTTVDIRSGRAAGAQTVGVLCGFGQEGELRRAGADLILPSIASLCEILITAHP